MEGQAFTALAGGVYGTLKLSWDDLQDIKLLESLALLANEIVCFLFLDRIAAEPSALKLVFQVSLQCRHAGINCFSCRKGSLACVSYLSEPPFSWLQWLPVQAGGAVLWINDLRALNDRCRFEQALLFD